MPRGYDRAVYVLKGLSDFLAGRGRSCFMLELLVPAEPAQLERLG